MQDILDLDRFPLHQPDSQAYRELVQRCQYELADNGLFNLEGLVKSSALEEMVGSILPVMETDSFTHSRSHNIYFKKSIPELAKDHQALLEFTTVNHTVCADQIPDNLLIKIYEWPPLVAFLERVMEKPKLFTMDDPLARVNVMAYYQGEALNWHFDRSEFTTTLLLQAPKSGGVFQYQKDLRSDHDPNYEGVGEFVTSDYADAANLFLSAGTLNVFKGKNTAHRVTPVEGGLERLIAVFSYYESRNVLFSEEERVGFYGRAG